MNTLTQNTPSGGKGAMVLSTKNVGKYFYDPVKFKALDNVSFDAYEGEFLTLVPWTRPTKANCTSKAKK
jgi:ABC-type glutathione transport system ATPase component